MADIERLINTIGALPVYLKDANGDPVTGVVFGDVAVKYMKYGDISLTTKVIVTADWKEIGNGLYSLSFTAAEFNTLKDFTWVVTNASSKQWTGFGQIISEEKSVTVATINGMDSNIDDTLLELAQIESDIADVQTDTTAILADTLELLKLNLFKTNEYQTYTYDGQGRTSTITLKMGSPTVPTSTWIATFTYDANNNVDTFNVVKQ